MSAAPSIPGVNLPTAAQEGAALAGWLAREHHHRYSSLVAVDGGSVLAFMLFLPQPNAHGLVVVVLRADQTRADLSDYALAWLDHLTLNGYRTAVCAGFLESQRAIAGYVSPSTTSQPAA